MTKEKEITIYHSPDADDAFMFYGLVKDAINCPGYKFKHDLCDIETLNQRTLAGELDVTAVSVHAYSQLQNDYVILSAGASMGGKDYGPRIVAKEKFKLNDGVVRNIAIPGVMTSAALALQIYLKESDIQANLIAVDFDHIFEAIDFGQVDAGVIIHEGQLTHTQEGFCLLQDLGQWWWEKTELPLPLGVNVVKKSLGSDAILAVGTALKQSILYSLENRKAALEYALSYGRGLSYEDADTFVGMYVNDYTVDLGYLGKMAIKKFLEVGLTHGIIKNLNEVEFVEL